MASGHPGVMSAWGPQRPGHHGQDGVRLLSASLPLTALVRLPRRPGCRASSSLPNETAVPEREVSCRGSESCPNICLPRGGLAAASLGPGARLSDSHSDFLDTVSRKKAKPGIPCLRGGHPRAFSRVLKEGQSPAVCSAGAQGAQTAHFSSKAVAPTAVATPTFSQGCETAKGPHAPLRENSSLILKELAH